MGKGRGGVESGVEEDFPRGRCGIGRRSEGMRR